jgi:hypothetical protein
MLPEFIESRSSGMLRSCGHVGSRKGAGASVVYLFVAWAIK